MEVTSLTDYDTGARLAPQSAFLVRGSDINPCARAHTTIGPDKQPMHEHFDRCSPSVLAFATRSAADRFARDHGGQIVRFVDVAAQFR